MSNRHARQLHERLVGTRGGAEQRADATVSSVVTGVRQFEQFEETTERDCHHSAPSESAENEMGA